MTCPKCGGDVYVIDTRPEVYGIRRRRECSNCKHRFTMVEIPMEEYDVFKYQSMNYKKILEDVKKSLETITHLLEYFEEEKNESNSM